MRKAITITIIILTALLPACYKAHNVARTSAPPTFKILIDDGNWHGSATDSTVIFTTKSYSQAKFNISFELTSGDPVNYPVIFYTSGLPTGITVNQDTFSFRLNNRITLFVDINTTGTFVINFNTFIVNGGLKTYPIVIKAGGCTDELAGTYAGLDPCGHFSYGTIWHDYKAIVTTIPGDLNRIRIKNFHGLGDDIEVEAIANCDHTIDIPLQTVNGYTFYGRGKGSWGFSNSVNNSGKPYISCNSDTTVYNGDTVTCMIQLQQ